MNPQTKKGLIIGGSILGVAIIATSIGLGIYFGLKDDNILEGPVVTVSYNDNGSGTAVRQDKWMNIDDNDGGDYVEGDYEATLVQNSYHRTASDDEDILDTVEMENGIGYLAHGYLSSNDLVKDKFKVLDIIEDGEQISWDDSDYTLKAPLDLVMRVPSQISDEIRDRFIRSDGTYNNSPLTVDELESAMTGYGTWLREESLQFDFAISMIIFNWASQSKTAAEGLVNDGLASYNLGTVTNEEFASWIKAIFSNEEWGIVNEEGDIDFNGSEGRAYILGVGGTSTNSAAVASILNTFSNTEFDGNKISITEHLQNIGSDGSWYQEESGADHPDWVTNPDNEFTYAQPGGWGGDIYPVGYSDFIGTQSKSMPSLTSTNVDEPGNWVNWGYDPDLYTDDILLDSVHNEYHSIDGTIDKENTFYNYDKIIEIDDFPIVTTMAVDNIVFFINEDIMFSTFDGDIVSPTALSAEGAKQLFQYGASWEEVASKNLINYK